MCGGRKGSVASRQPQWPTAAALELIRTDVHVRIVLDEWYSFIVGRNQAAGEAIDKEAYLRVLIRTYKAIGTKDGSFLHPTSDQAQECASDEWASLSKVNDSRLSRQELDEALISRALPWLLTRQIEASSMSVAVRAPC